LDDTVPVGTASAILGCAGLALTQDEARFFRDIRPYGFILFARNVADRDQLRGLVDSLRETVGWHAPVLIDQEGGRVQRMTAPHWRRYPAARVFGELYESDPSAAVELCRLNAWLLAGDLAEVGIDVDCLPLLDLPVPGASDVIGRRAFSEAVEPTVALARAQVEGLAAAGVAGVAKHIPGHGRALVDSHHHLPTVEANAETLDGHDFAPFRAFADMAYGMTGHLLFPAFDATAPSTLSPVVVREVIRGRIGFDGLLMTDDLSMQALGGGIGERAGRAMVAGCDLVLHCNGEMKEMAEVAAAVPLLAGEARRRAAIADAHRLGLRTRARPAPDDAEGRLRELLDGVA